jgi:transcriptional regulator with XRE-family HTH domain
MVSARMTYIGNRSNRGRSASSVSVHEAKDAGPASKKGKAPKTSITRQGSFRMLRIGREAMKRIGSTVRVRRLSLGLEREELARRIAVSSAYINNVEAGKIAESSRAYLILVALGLGLKPSSLHEELAGADALWCEAPDPVVDEQATPEPAGIRTLPALLDELKAFFQRADQLVLSSLAERDKLAEENAELKSKFRTMAELFAK